MSRRLSECVDLVHNNGSEVHGQVSKRMKSLQIVACLTTGRGGELRKASLIRIRVYPEYL